MKYDYIKKLLSDDFKKDGLSGFDNCVVIAIEMIVDQGCSIEDVKEILSFARKLKEDRWKELGGNV